MKQANISLLQQQRYQQQSQLSSTSSSSPDSSPPSQYERLHRRQLQPSGASPSQHKGALSESSSTSEFSRYLPNLSPPLQFEHQHHQMDQTKASTSSQLPRQTAFDTSQSMPTQKSQAALPTTSSVVQGHPQRFGSRIITFSKNQQQQHQQKVQQLLNQHRMQTRKAETASSAQPCTSHEQFNVFVTGANIRLPFDSDTGFPKVGRLESSLPSTVFGSQSGGDAIRPRSISQPVSVMPIHVLSDLHTRSPQSFSNTSKTLRTASGIPEPSTQHSKGYDSLYSESLSEPSSQPLSLNIPTSITIEDSSSSDENVNEQLLFLSALSHKRPLSEPVISGEPKRSNTSASMAFTSSVFSYDPQVTLRNLSTVHCFGLTRTSNTPSSSPLGLVPSRIPSPTPAPRFAGKTSSTPSSSATASPAPLSSLSSLLELSVSSPVLPSASFDPSAEITDAPLSNQTIGSPVPASVQCTSAGLQATIPEPIPEWYSFLADLEDGSMATFTSRHGASSSHGTPMPLTPKQQDHPPTPDPVYVNVPKIIDELLDSDDQAM